MEKRNRKIRRYVIGYLSGFTFFMILIPLLMYFLRIAAIKTGIELFLLHNSLVSAIISMLLVISGLGTVLWTNLLLFFEGKGGPADAFGLAISPRTSCLVTSGPYRLVRHPMVSGMLVFYIGLAVGLNSLSVLIFTVLLIVSARFYLKQVEEKKLIQLFGNDYLEYRKRVKHILPLL